MTAQKTTPCIWIQHDAEAAIRFYTELIPNSKVVQLDSTENPIGDRTVMALFELGGVTYRAIGGAVDFALSPAFSISVDCVDQAEVDRYWDALTEGGEPGRCGWLVDRWGLSWQIVPRQLQPLLTDPNPARANAALQCMFGMSKLVIAELEAAANAAE